MGDMGDYFRDVAPFLKEGRKRARDGAHERIKKFFQNNNVIFEEGSNTLIFRTPAGTVCYYTPSQRMQHKNNWKSCSPTACMKYVERLRSNTNG